MKTKTTKKLPYWLDQDFLLNLLEQLPSHVFWKDKEGVYLGCNSTFAQSFGLKPEDIIGKTDYDLPVSQEDNENYRAQDLEVITSLVPKLNIEEKQTLSDGREIFLLTSKVPLLDENQNTFGVLGVYSDISELKKTTKALEKAKKLAETASQAKSDFISNMSHDLRTPITGILGVAQDLLHIAQESEALLKTNALSNPKNSFNLTEGLIQHVKNDSVAIINALVPLINLFDEILETVGLEQNSSSQSESPESFDIYELIEHNVALLQPTARHKKLDLTIHIDPGVPKYLRGLRNYIDRTLINLISNALIFTKEGSVTIKMSVLEPLTIPYKKEDKVLIQISIEDTGIGISENKFESIFEQFSRLHASHEGIYKGHGLGLYTVNTYIKAMGGKIKVQSQVGRGSCFTLTIPFFVSDKVDRPRDTSFFIPMNSVLESKLQTGLSLSSTVKKPAVKVLVVEDHPIAARALLAGIKPFNCEVDIVENGAQAIEMARSNSYGIIFMDIGLPDISGIEVTKAIRSLPDATKAEVPIVAITGHADTPEIQKECLKAKMQDILSKPARPLLLKSVFQRYVFNDKQTEANTVATLSDNFSGLCLLDWKTSEDMCSSDPKRLSEILAILSSDLKKSSGILAKAHKERNIKALHAELHRVLGGVVYIASPRLETVLKSFQKISDWDECDRFYHYLQETIHAFRAECEKCLTLEVGV